MFLSAPSDGITECFFSGPFNGCHSVLVSTSSTANAGPVRWFCHIFEHPAKSGEELLEQSQPKAYIAPGHGRLGPGGREAPTERSSTPKMMT